MRQDMCIDICVDASIDMCADTCTGMCVDTCTDMCVDMRTLASCGKLSASLAPAGADVLSLALLNSGGRSATSPNRSCEEF